MSRRPNGAKILRGSSKSGVREQSPRDLRDDEQDRSDAGQQDHPQGPADGAEARGEAESPTLQEHVETLIQRARGPTPAVGSMDYHRQEDIFKRMGTGAPPAEIKYDEHWRGKVGNSPIVVSSGVPTPSSQSASH
jgi:hypothetical protein